MENSDNMMDSILAAVCQQGPNAETLANADLSACDIAPNELPPGSAIHEYEIIKTLGSGGFGITYLAQEKHLQRKVVIKESFPASICYRNNEGDVLLHNPENEQSAFDWALSNFRREARLLANLDHPCLPKVYSYFQAHGTAYYVTKFIEGPSLHKLAADYAKRNERIPQDALLGMLVRLLDTLDHMHGRHILHRDIKPDNILVDRDGMPVIIDFGAARESRADADETVIESRGFTPAEQLTEGSSMGPWTDLYALGATLYHTLTGKVLPSGKQRALYDTADALSSNSELLQHYTPRFLAAIDRAIRPNAQDRYQSVAEWMQQLHTNKL